MGERATSARARARWAERAPAAAKEAVNERATRRQRGDRGGDRRGQTEAARCLPRAAFFISLVLGGALIVFAKTPKATLAVGIYAGSLPAPLGTSALYHRVNWKRPQVRGLTRRLDHSMIFFPIAGTYRPSPCSSMVSGTLAIRDPDRCLGGSDRRGDRRDGLDRPSEMGLGDGST